MGAARRCPAPPSADSRLCTLADPGPEAPPARLPPATSRLVRAIRDGSGSGMLPPPVVPGPANTVVPGVALGGKRDARVLAHALASRRFTPARDLLERLDRWCQAAAPRFAAVVAPGVLAATNAGLFGPVVAECFMACAASPGEPARRLAGRRGRQYQAFLELFLARLERDLAGEGWPADPELAGPVTGLRAHDEETHNGGQRVLRLELAGGGRVAYKPRPASGETLFLSPGTSLFALLNRLPPGSGPVRLPELRSWTGPEPARGPGFAGYSWQEWVEPPSAHGVVVSEDGWQQTGTVLTPPQADRFWRNTGALTAACYAFGITDLHSGNLLVGARGGADEPLMYPVDLEVYLAKVARLSDTFLIHDPAVEGANHHVGLEHQAHWCTLAGPPMVFWRGPGGTLELHWRTVQFGRTENRSVVADTTGRTGYGPYLAAMLRGMFDAWTLLGRHRSTVCGFLEAHRARHTVRVLPRATASYLAALPYQRKPGRHRPPGAEELAPAEREQLARGDVPYFFRAGSGGALLSTPPPPEPFRTVPVALGTEPDRTWPPQPAAVAGEVLTLSGLGAALRDAVAYVFDDVPASEVDDRAGVRMHLPAPGAGQVSFDWPEQDRRITYRWQGATIRVRVDPLSAPVPSAPPAPAAGAIRHRLLRLDRADQLLRNRWTASGGTDPVLATQLHRLTGTGLVWLQTVVEQHGWPGRALVGEAAAAAASRLVQHGEGQLEFRRHCLELVRRAAAAGDMPARDIAYLTDALRLAEGRPQWYGTKFGRVGNTLQPCPIEAPEEVDARRADLGMEPLAWYARRIRATFPLVPERPASNLEVTTG